MPTGLLDLLALLHGLLEDILVDLQLLSKDILWLLCSLTYPMKRGKSLKKLYNKTN